MNAARLVVSVRGLAVVASLVTLAATSSAQVTLADQPVFTAVNVPGNLALALSVEFPTAISVAHPTRTYSSANTYIGYFDPAKCYTYRYTDGTGTDNYFYPDGAATNRTCTSKWSGNYLNWASMQTIDPFRWALTGGYRVIDTSSLTVLEKAWAPSNLGSTSNFPDSSVSTSTVVAGATPFSSAYSVGTRIWALGNKMRFMAPGTGGANSATFSARYYNNKTQNGTAVATRTEGYINYNITGNWFPAGVSTTNVSANWTGSVKAPTAGTYSFKIRGDDGVRLRVRVNNSGTTYSINNTGWIDQGATDYLLSVPGVAVNDTLNIEVEYYQGGGGGEVSLQWQLPGGTTYANVGGGGAIDLYGTPTHYNPANALQGGTLYEAFIRVKVCDTAASAADREANCTTYGAASSKPTGLMQKYADKIRYSAFGYLNDNNVNRDGGVLRAKQKFIGPTSPVPGGIPVANAKSEWDASTGVMTINPDPADATATGVTNSGVMNYLNKFGEITQTYKTYDPVSELYYAVQRYYRNMGNVPAWTNNANTTQIDGFPVITAWDDPIKYSCQRNFVLGIGDVNTHADRNLPGATGASEPSKPAEVAADTAVDSYDWTNKVGVLQGLGSSLGATQPYGGCCTNNGALMAGLAYWANINDIRSDLTGIQTIQTYWLDVLEYQAFKSNNQFYLAAKYGGFKPPSGYSAATATAADFANNATTKSWWSTTTDTTPDGTPRPDNYYTAARADQMVDGLTKTFSSIASQLSAYSTSFSTALPQVSALGVASYSTKFDAKSWTGELEASLTTFNATTGEPSLQSQWTFAGKLDTQAAGTGWNTGRNIVTYDTAGKVGVKFRSGTGGIPSAQLALLDTSYVTGDDSANYLSYLRGDRTNEVSSTASGSTKAYRDRAKLLGDIVNAKARPVAAPAAPYSAANNPGYDTFKTTYANRTQMVYVASNDGMVHAVNGSLTGADAGKEVWAYVPGALFNGPTGAPSTDGLASFGNPTFTHHFMVDATPLAIDVDFGRTSGGTGTDWRTILVGGLGKGGKSIYALDITDPASVTTEAIAAQKVLWEFKHNDLGYTYGQPVVVKTRKYGWTIVVGSGYNNADGIAYFFFINPRTGALLEQVAAPCPALSSPTVAACSPSNQAGMAHINAFVLDLTDGYADAIYGGDLMGNVWRLDVTGTGGYPTPVRFARLVGSDGNVLPITSKPLPVVQPGTNRRYITVGTGRLLDPTDLNNTQPQRFFAILDGTNATFSKDGTISGEIRDLPLTSGNFPLTVSNLLQLVDLNSKISLDLRTQVGWYVDLGVSAGGPGWRVLSDPTSFYGTVAFAATSPSSTDPCAPNGTSRIYAIDLGSGYCGLTGGGSACYVSKTDGVVIDLTFYSVNINGVGKSVLLAGKDNCSGNNCQPVEKVETRSPVNLGLQRLNWREILINN